MFKTIYKEKGLSSFKAINNWAKNNNIKKIGHTGTLDPLAQGLLLVATDDDTKLIQFISNKDKKYKVSCKLGYISKTMDEEGPISFVSNYQPTLEQIKDVLNQFQGAIKQTPPIFSAKKIGGYRAYELARKNQDVKLNEIDVQIYDISNIDYQYPFLSFEAHVSNGTYIRVLIDDIGKKLTTGAYMTFLERTMVNGVQHQGDINLFDLIKLHHINIDNLNQLKKWFDGKIKLINEPDGYHDLVFEQDIFGVIKVKDQKIIQYNLFGNKFLKLTKKL